LGIGLSFHREHNLSNDGARLQGQRIVPVPLKSLKSSKTQRNTAGTLAIIAAQGTICDFDSWRLKAIATNRKIRADMEQPFAPPLASSSSLESKDADKSMRHSAVVRLTHWINMLALFALIISGTAILVAHPRLYWGETGGFGSPALIELPLPLNLDQSGWGRSLHFLSAWICVLNGIVYVVLGLISRHFKTNMALKYTVLQRLTYSSVVFVFLPLMILSGLAMSPAVTALVPIVEVFGGYQSSRTIHFFVTNLLVLFVIVHVTMVYRSGFLNRTRAMITGTMAAKEKL
jgi:thiosulfate reductase cytochrome b subunit